ncbi:hypothetical protein KAU39_06070 [bacterium]|nr:hypothetical protein [bacterium]
MKNPKKFIIAFSLIIFFFVSFNVPVRGGHYMTNAKFLDLIVRVMDLESMLSVDTEFMSVAELYKAKMEILARKGIYVFLNTEPHKMVKRRIVVTFLYLAIVKNVSPDTTDEEKLAFLVENGWLKIGDIDGIMLEEEIIRALNIPDIVTAMVETYIAPSSADGIKEIEFPLEVYEEPASPIY